MAGVMVGVSRMACCLLSESCPGIFEELNIAIPTTVIRYLHSSRTLHMHISHSDHIISQVNLGQHYPV
jgi:hypothetical protein